MPTLLEQINALKEERAKIVTDQRAILDKADEEKRDLTADETQNYQNMETRFDELTDEIKEKADAMEAADRRKKDLESREADMKRPENKPIKPHRFGHGLELLVASDRMREFRHGDPWQPRRALRGHAETEPRPLGDRSLGDVCVREPDPARAHLEWPRPHDRVQQ